MITKSIIRNQMRNLRINIPLLKRKKATIQINQNILKNIRTFHRIAIYQSMGSEVNLNKLINHINRHYPKVQLFKPYYHPFSKRMWFIPLAANKLSLKKKFRAENLDLMVIPIIAIDLQGYRLGQGGGYYDASLKHAILKNSPKKIAVGFDCQLIKTIPHEKHDIRMNTFISEKRILQFK